MGKPPRAYIPYRSDLTTRARKLRRNPTAAERKLWFEFLRALPAKFTRQKPLGIYIADFYCSSRQLVIELDGDTHYTAQAERYDCKRTAALALSGLRVLRFSNLEVMQQFEAVCQQIAQALADPLTEGS